jgi:hypothetical protein
MTQRATRSGNGRAESGEPESGSLADYVSPVSRRSRSHLGPARSAPALLARCRSSRSAETKVTGLVATLATMRRVSSPLCGACTTVTPSSSPSWQPVRAAPSSTTTTGRSKRLARAADLTCATKVRAAPGRSRHQPVGLDPTTFAASIRSTRPVSLIATT